MVSQSISRNKLLSNVMIAGVAFTVLSVVAGTLWILFSYKQVTDLRAEYASLKDSIAQLRPGQFNRGMVAAVDIDSANNSLPVAEDKKELKDTTTPVVKSNVAVNEKKEEPESVAKTSAPLQKNTVEAKPPAMASGKSIVISYYYRKADNESLQATLKNIGYSFELKELEESTGFQKSNCIWFGKGVPLTAVKKVAVALIQSGNTIKGIKRFPMSYRNTSYKRNIIEVGMDLKLENYTSKPLSIFEVERAKKFK